MADRLLTDLRSAARSLRASPGLLSAAVLMLALAAGANAAISALINRGLLAPPALVASPDRVFTLGFRQDGEDAGPLMTTTSFPAFRTVEDDVTGLADAAAWRRSTTTVMLAGAQRQADALLVSGSYFRLLGSAPAIGRTLEPGDDRSSSPAAVLSHAFWRSAFGADPGVIGRRVSIGGVDYVVAGVMPAGFSGHSTSGTDVWLPLAAAMQGSPGWEHETFRNIISIVVRLKDAAAAPAAAAQVSAALGRAVVLRPLEGGADVSSVERRIAFGLTALSILVVVLALANTATLLLVRGAGRRRDAAIRAALGATRARLLTQTALEAVALAAVTGALALLAASWFEDGLRRVLLPEVAPAESLDTTALIAASIAAALTAAVAAAAGIVQLPSRGSFDGLSRGERVAGGRRMLQRGLLVLQVAVSVILLAGLGMFGRSLYNLGAQQFGFRLDDVLVVDFPPGPRQLPDAFFEEAIERVRALPGVERATFIQSAPFAGFHVPPISVPGLAEPPQTGGQLPFLTAATPELLEILGVEIVEGRGFAAADDRGAPVVIVNQSMARGAWPGQSAVGKCIRLGFDPDFDPAAASGPPVPPPSLPCREVIGVARDMRQRSVVPAGNEDKLMQYFVPFSQVPPPPAAFGAGPQIQGMVIRAAGNVDAVAAAVSKAVIDGRSDLPLLRVRPYRAILGRQMRPWQLATQLLGIFAVLALMVAAVGLYAAFAHAVVDRRREMAIRLAVGADRTRVVRLVMGDALRIAGAGMAAGGIAAAIAGRWAESLLYGTSPADPVVLGGAAAVMASVAALATLLPARTAARTDPATLLK